MAGESLDIVVKVNNAVFKVGDVFEVVVENDLNQPDMATILVSNVKGQYSDVVKLGDDCQITASKEPLFKGEVIGLEPVFDSNLPSRCVIRAFNRLHRLTRGRKSRTFANQSDQDIVRTVCQGVSLSAKSDSSVTIRHDHVYQHNQTDLDFLHQRAARIDYELVVDDTTLFFRPRKTDRDSGVQLVFGEGDFERFRPKLSGARQVNKVIVRGWDPVQKKEIVGEATATATLGGQSAPRASGLQGVEMVSSDRPVHSKQEADALAKGLLKSIQMGYITGDILTAGDPRLKAGVVVTVKVGDDKFNGKYYVVGCRHRFLESSHGLGGSVAREAGYRTFLKVQRDSEG